jgi:hypothetical protein
VGGNLKPRPPVAAASQVSNAVRASGSSLASPRVPLRSSPSAVRRTGADAPATPVDPAAHSGGGAVADAPEVLRMAASLAFYFLYRFRSLERVVPGHRGSRAVGPVPWAAGVGMGVALVVTGVLLWLALASATTTSAK